MKNVTIFIADSGLGDFIVATGWIKYFCNKYNRKALLLLGKSQTEYFDLLQFGFDYEIIKFENIFNLNFKNVNEIISIRSKPKTFESIKIIAKENNINFYGNFFHERKYSFFYRRLFMFIHSSRIHDFNIKFPLNYLKILYSKKIFNYEIPSKEILLSKISLKNKFNLKINKYVVIAGSGQDKTRKLTTEQINYFSENINENLILIGQNWNLNKLNNTIINLIDKTDLLEAISLIFHSKLVITVDSALAHISNAITIRNSIMIMGNAPKYRWGPLKNQNNSKLLHTNTFGFACRCKNCKGLTKNYSCMQELKTVKKCLKIINRSKW